MGWGSSRWGTTRWGSGPSTGLISKYLSAGLALSVSVGRTIGKGVAPTLALVGAVGRTTRRTVQSGVALAGSVPAKVRFKAIAAEIALSADVGRTIGKGVSSGVALSVSVGRTIRKDISSGLALSVSVGRTLSRQIAATIVLTGSLVRSARKIFEGGVDLTAQVGRLIKKQIQAGISLAAEVPRTVYDMAWEMNKSIRKILARVAITYSDPFFSAGLTTEASETGEYTYPAQTADNVTEEAFKWFSLHRNALDGTFHPLPGAQEYSVGWWSATLCSAAGAFLAPPVLTITHTARTVSSLLVVGDDKLEEYPTWFVVRLYSAGDVLVHTEACNTNTDITWTKDVGPFDDIVKQTLTITKWSRGGSVAKIAQFFTMIEEIYDSEDGELFDIHVLEEREFSGATIPQGNVSSNEITIKLNNIDDTFSAGNVASRLYGMLLNNRAIEAWLGCDLRSGERIWFPLGTFYSHNWSTPEGEAYAQVSGMDMLDRLKQTEFSTSEVYQSVTLHDLAVTVMSDAGLTDADWEIDPVLDTAAYEIPYAWFGRMSHREALRLIAAAALGQAYCNRDGKVVVAVYVPPARMPASDFHFTQSNFFEIDHPLKWSEMANYVQAQAAPRVPSAEDDICIDSEAFTVPGSGSVTKAHFFDIAPCVDVVDPLVFTQSGTHITLSSMTIYAWGVSATYSNSDPADEQVLSVTIRGKRLEVQGGRIVVAQDEASIGANGKQTLASPISSEFWQKESQVQAVADSLLESYKDPRRDVVMQARGNIASLLGDRVVAPDFRDEVSAEYGLMRQDINYDGGLEIAVVAQRIPDGVVTHYKSIQAGIELQSSMLHVNHWKHIVAGIELQSCVAREQTIYDKTVTAGLALGGAVGRTVSRALSGGLTVAGSLTKFATSQRRALSAVMALSGAVGRAWDFIVGSGAINGASEITYGWTALAAGTPAMAGTITTIRLWAEDKRAGWKVGTFYNVGGDDYQVRDQATIPDYGGNGYHEYTGYSLEAHAGDLIGIYIPVGSLSAGNQAGGSYLTGNDGFTAVRTYSSSSYPISLQGLGSGSI